MIKEDGVIGLEEKEKKSKHTHTHIYIHSQQIGITKKKNSMFIRFYLLRTSFQSHSSKKMMDFFFFGRQLEKKDRQRVREKACGLNSNELIYVVVHAAQSNVEHNKNERQKKSKLWILLSHYENVFFRHNISIRDNFIGQTMRERDAWTTQRPIAICHQSSLHLAFGSTLIVR